MAELNHFPFYFEITATENCPQNFWEDCRIKNITKSNIRFEDINGNNLDRYIMHFNSAIGSERLTAYIKMPQITDSTNTSFKVVLDKDASLTSLKSATYYMPAYNTTYSNKGTDHSLRYPIFAGETNPGTALGSSNQITLDSNTSIVIDESKTGLDKGYIEFTGAASDPCIITIFDTDIHTRFMHPGNSYWDILEFSLKTPATIPDKFEILNFTISNTTSNVAPDANTRADDFSDRTTGTNTVLGSIMYMNTPTNDDQSKFVYTNAYNTPNSDHFFKKIFNTNDTLTPNTWYNFKMIMGNVGDNYNINSLNNVISNNSNADSIAYLDDSYLSRIINNDSFIGRINLGSLDGKTFNYDTNYTSIGDHTKGNCPNIKFSNINLQTIMFETGGSADWYDEGDVGADKTIYSTEQITAINRNIQNNADYVIVLWFRKEKRSNFLK